MKHYDVEFALRQKVNEVARAYVGGGGKMHQIATRAGVSQTTVSRLVYRETQHPRLHTVIAVLDALGYTLQLTHGSSLRKDEPSAVAKLPVGRAAK